MRTRNIITGILLLALAEPILSTPALAEMFVVDTMRVDVTAENSVQAQSIAFANARLAAARKLVERLTTSEDRFRIGGVEMTNAIASRLASAIDVREEKRSGTRYFGVLSVKFDEKAVARYLDDIGLAFVTSPAAKALLVPVAVAGQDSYAWRRAWIALQSDHLLTPFAVSDKAYYHDSDWTEMAEDAKNIGAGRGIVAQLGRSNGSLYVALSEAQSGIPTEALDTLGPFANVEDAADKVLAYLEASWKRLTLVREDSITHIRAAAIYDSLSDWRTIRNSLRQLANVSQFNVRSIMTGGADLDFSFSGAPAQLSAELRARGVILSAATEGWELRTLNQ